MSLKESVFLYFGCTSQGCTVHFKVPDNLWVSGVETAEDGLVCSDCGEKSLVVDRKIYDINKNAEKGWVEKTDFSFLPN